MAGKLEGFGPEDKPERKRKRGSQDRFAFHQCFHGDALLGVAMLDDGERGVYVTIIWTMYQQRSALPLDYAWLARINNIPVQRLRARLASLVAKGRLVVDEEAGLVYDERTMRELVAAERYNEAQTDRAKLSWKNRGGKGAKAPELRLVPPSELADLSAALENVSGAEQIQPPPQPPPQPSPQPPENHGRRKASNERNQGPENSRGHANHIHIHIDTQPEANSGAAGGALLPDGSAPRPVEKSKKAEALAALRLLKSSPAEPAKGLDETEPGGDSGAQAGDHRAVRT